MDSLQALSFPLSLALRVSRAPNFPTPLHFLAPTTQANACVVSNAILHVCIILPGTFSISTFVVMVGNLIKFALQFSPFPQALIARLILFRFRVECSKRTDVAVELSRKMSLTVDSITQLWEKKLLPSVRAELKAEITVIRQKMKDLSQKIDEIEDSQKWLSALYDNITKTIQVTKKQAADTTKSLHQLDERTADGEDKNYWLKKDPGPSSTVLTKGLH